MNRAGAGSAADGNFVALCVMLPRVFPEGTSREGGHQLAGRHPDWMQHYSTKSHVPLGKLILCQTAGMSLRCGAWMISNSLRC